jgi:REP element-mobilizing transposase RayT
MPPSPLYSAVPDKIAYHLRYAWTGWPTSGSIPQVDLEIIKPLWETDGLRLLETHFSSQEVQLAFSTKPHVDPVFLAARAKGRLQHAIRTASSDFAGFSRKVAVRAVGDNTTADVERYIEHQVPKERFVDTRFETEMEQYTVVCPEVDLREASESLQGRYWYNLHIVLIVADRDRVVDRKTLTTLRDGALRIAAKKACTIARLAVMPDHMHVALRGDIRQSPQEIALSFQNNLAYLLGQKRLWNDGFYVGSFGEYRFNAIRAAVRQERS